MRGHGKSKETSSYSLKELSTDVIKITNTIFKKLPAHIILVGHSLGASVMVTVSLAKEIKNIRGLVVIDVVEGTALDSLDHMLNIIKKRPIEFNSINDAINYSKISIRNRESALISIPDQLILIDGVYKWRTNLLETEPYWREWFEDLSNKFLNCQGGRMLILSARERLDEKLLIGQMQGKFQLKVIETGHCVHEDEPEKVAEMLVGFLQWNQPIQVKRFEIPIDIKKGATAPI